MKTLLQCHIKENRRSYPDELNGGLCIGSNGLAWGAQYQISSGVEGLHSFSDIYSWTSGPLFEASWLWVCTEALSATLEKPAASDLHCLAPLVCSVWPVLLEEESGPITSRRCETNMMSSPRYAITGCR